MDMKTEDIASLKQAVALLEQDTLTEKMTRFVGKPIDALMSKLPSGAESQIHELVKKALHKAADVALWSLKNQPGTAASTKSNKFYAALSGGIGGAFGFTALVAELPVSTTIMLRAVADIARSEGFDLSDVETKLACIEVFSLGGPSEDDDAVDTAYYSARSFTAEAVKSISKELSELAAKQATVGVTQTVTPLETSKWLAKLIEKVASRFGIVITEKAAAQAVPIIGAVTGATLNTMFTDYYQDMAKGHFIVKRLEREYGVEVVKTEYLQLSNELKKH
ncbi:MAG: EcsC family protein [Vibrio sp.]